MTTIGSFYRDKTVFITGGTGFIGKIIIEKLLRYLKKFCLVHRQIFLLRCTDVGKIYMLIRAKKGVNPEDRLTALFKSPLFDDI